MGLRSCSLNQYNMKTTTKVAIAVGAGLVLGGVLGILYAPAKGSETRDKLSRQRRKWREQVDRGVKTGQNILSRMSQRIDETVGD